MSFHPFNEVAQAVTTALNSPGPVASALAQANWSRPFDSLAAASDDATWQPESTSTTLLSIAL
jgi:hypothetical protein